MQRWEIFLQIFSHNSFLSFSCFRYQDDLLVMDKTGRFQRFLRNGKFSEVCAKIDAYLGNGFTIRNDEVIVACSGIVLDKVYIFYLA